MPMMGGAAKMSGVATRHPIPAEYQIHDARFLALIVPGAELRHLHDGQPVGGRAGVPA